MSRPPATYSDVKQKEGKRRQVLIDFTVSSGLSKKQAEKKVDNLIERHPMLLASKAEKIKQNLKNLWKIGFKKKTILPFPMLITHSTDTVKKKIQKLEEIGFKKKTILSFPTLVTHSTDTVKKKIQKLEEIGFKRKTILSLPALATSSIDTVKKKIQKLEEIIGCSNSLEIINRYPFIISLNSKNLCEKKEWYKKNLNLNIFSKPNYLIQSLEKSKQRTKILDKIGYNYISKPYKIFINSKEWNKFISNYK